MPLHGREGPSSTYNCGVEQHDQASPRSWRPAVEEILRILRESSGTSYFGEPVSQLEHALQAAQCARDAGASEEAILAALLHDIGHLVAGPEAEHESGVGVIDHDAQGAEFLRARGFSERVIALVEGHVNAKRYLTATNPEYLAKLSPASLQTLALQGGPFSDEEAVAFRAHPCFREMLQLRSWDEQAKRTDWTTVSPLDSYAEMLERHLLAQQG